MKKSIAIKIEKKMYSFDKFYHNNLFLYHISLVQATKKPFLIYCF